MAPVGDAVVGVAVGTLLVGELVVGVLTGEAEGERGVGGEFGLRVGDRVDGAVVVGRAVGESDVGEEVEVGETPGIVGESVKEEDGDADGDALADPEEGEGVQTGKSKVQVTPGFKH